MSSTPLKAWLSMALLMTLSVSISAQESDLVQTAINFNVLERNKVTTDVEYLEVGLSGDTIDPYSGSLSFRATDVSIPGNADLPVKISRSINNSGPTNGRLADWVLDIPRLEGRYALKTHFDFDAGPDCTKNLPDSVDNPSGDEFYAKDFHNGLHLHNGDGYSGLVISPTSPSHLPYPLPAGYNRLTKENWLLKCTGIDGKDYIAQSPTGLTYTFSVVSRKGAAPAAKGEASIASTRTVAKMVSRIEDKFGNWVNFGYEAFNLGPVNGQYPTNRLTTITANDGRLITLNYHATGDYKDLLSSVAAGSQNWLYSYIKVNDLPYLQQVNRPDGRSWLYNLAGFRGFVLDGSEDFETTYNTINLSVTHPYGTKADFALRSQWQYKPGYINPHISIKDTTQKEKQGRNRVLAVLNKTLTIPGSAALNWTYQYADFEHNVTLTSGGQWLDRTSIDQQVNTITGPYNTVVNRFSRWKDWQEGALLSKKTYEPAGTVAVQEYSTSYTYSGSFLGAGVGFDGSNRDMNQKARVSATQVIKQNGNSYTDIFSQYNDYGALLEHSSSNNFNGKVKHIKRTYQHDMDNWVLNLPSKTWHSSVALADNTTQVPTTQTTYQSVNFKHTTPNISKTALMANIETVFGAEQQRYSSYHNDDGAAGFTPGQLGLLKTVQYPTALIGGGFRYQSYNQYHRGQPKNITLPGRYNATAMAFTREINDFGWVTQTTDFEQNTTRYGYDNIGRIQYVDLADARWADTVFNWSYTFGQPIRTVSRCTLNAQRNGCADAVKSTTTTQYDGLLRPTLITNTDVLNNITVYQNHRYTAFNQPAFQSYASTSPTETNGVSFAYDALGRLRSQTTSGGGTVTNSYLTNNKIKVSSQVDSNQVNETTTTYLAYGAPSYQQAILIQSPENVTTAITRNLYGNITSVTQSGYHGSTPVNQTEHRAYDNQQRLCQIARTDVGTTVMGHNTGGEVIWQALGQTAASHTACNSNVSNSQKLHFGYDNLGEKYTVTGTNSPSVTYTLNKNGDLIQLVSGSVSQTYAYNSARLLESETLALSGKSLNLDYQYNSLGHLSSLTYPNASEVSFNPNAFGQSQQATRVGANYATNAKYHPNGIIKTFTYGNGISHTTSLNTRQMPNKIHDHLAGSDRLNLSYSYDYQNNVKSIIDGIDANFSLTSLNYDGLDRLTSTVGGNGIGDSNLSYDGLGNIRTYRTLNSNKDHNFNYQYDTSTFRLTGVTGTGAAGYNFNHSTNGVADSYDNRGNVTHNGIRSFKYNPLNHMTESDGNQYLYDGFNRRVKIIDSNGTSYSMYSQAGKLLYRETSDGGINYIFLGDKLIAKEGMMPVRTNSRSHYKPFGDSIEAPKDDVGYTGHKFDTDLGWSYMQQRYKDPVVGRFMSNDPVGFTGEVDTFNRYSYVANNPYKYTDPTGEAKDGDSASTLGGVISGAILGEEHRANVERLKMADATKRTGGKKHNKKGSKQTEPTLPDKKIAQQDGVTVEHNYKSGDHATTHAHVVGGGKTTKIGPNGNPIKGQPELTSSQKKVVKGNKSVIRNSLNKIGKWLKYHEEQ